MMRKLTHGVVELTIGNIVDQQVDAIVNAANSSLAGGGGVDGAIHRAAGPKLLELCLALPVDDHGRRCTTGDVKTTEAGRLNAKYVIHAVGPVYNAENSESAHELLALVHKRALAAAASHHCQSIAFPAISTGAYRFPIREAATIAINSVCTYLENEQGIPLVRFVLFQQSQFDVFKITLDQWQNKNH
jgi:O-acetyl-ADP-ribose deacetylase